MTYAAIKHAEMSECNVDFLINDNLQLVRRLAWHVYGKVSSSTELEDLIQIGMIALVESARQFEDRGYQFSTYAGVRIKGAMIDHLRRGTEQSRKAPAIRRAIETARAQIESSKPGRATAAQIASEMGISLDEYYRMENAATFGAKESIDEIYSEFDISFCADNEHEDDRIDRLAVTERLAKAISTLDQRSQLVLQMYFFEEMNLEEIGAVLNVSSARICQIKSAALNKLKIDQSLRPRVADHGDFGKAIEKHEI